MTQREKVLAGVSGGFSAGAMLLLFVLFSFCGGCLGCGRESFETALKKLEDKRIADANAQQAEVKAQEALFNKREQDRAKKVKDENDQLEAKRKATEKDLKDLEEKTRKSLRKDYEDAQKAEAEAKKVKEEADKVKDAVKSLADELERKLQKQKEDFDAELKKLKETAPKLPPKKAEVDSDFDKAFDKSKKLKEAKDSASTPLATKKKRTPEEQELWDEFERLVAVNREMVPARYMYAFNANVVRQRNYFDSLGLEEKKKFLQQARLSIGQFR